MRAICFLLTWCILPFSWFTQSELPLSSDIQFLVDQIEIMEDNISYDGVHEHYQCPNTPQDLWAFFSVRTFIVKPRQTSPKIPWEISVNHTGIYIDGEIREVADLVKTNVDPEKIRFSCDSYTEEIVNTRYSGCKFIITDLSRQMT